MLQAAELGVAAPWVIAHRLAGIARAGAMPGRRDRAESLRMGTEKFAAGLESWTAMAMLGWSLQQTMFRAALRAMSARGVSPATSWAPWIALCFEAARGIEAMASPFHRRAVANSRRLSAVRRRR